ncbi:hypothetical protein [Hydrogenimonas sp.]
MSEDKLFFFLYLAVAVTLVAIHNLPFFAILTLFLILLSPAMALKTVKMILLFNISVTLGYALQMAFIGDEDRVFIVLFNLRVFDITFLTLYLVPKINVAHALSFSKTLQFLYLASLSQIESFTRSYRDFILALRSRTVKPLSERKKRDFIGAMLYYFLKKALGNSKERAQALRARGFFDNIQ